MQKGTVWSPTLGAEGVPWAWLVHLHQYGAILPWGLGSEVTHEWSAKRLHTMSAVL